MARINVRTTTVRSEELALPAFCGFVNDTENGRGHVRMGGSGMIIMSDGSSLDLAVEGKRYQEDGDFVSAQVKVTFEQVALVEGIPGSEPADREGFAEVLAVLEGFVAKVRAEMGEA